MSTENPKKYPAVIDYSCERSTVLRSNPLVRLVVDLLYNKHVQQNPQQIHD